jgi:hypothetical protein
MGLFNRKKATIVDLREAAQPRLEFGLPTPCPSCGEPGYLDSIDLSRALMFQHCPSCFTKWETTEADLAEANG